MGGSCPQTRGYVPVSELHVSHALLQQYQLSFGEYVTKIEK